MYQMKVHKLEKSICSSLDSLPVRSWSSRRLSQSMTSASTDGGSAAGAIVRSLVTHSFMTWIFSVEGLMFMML